MGTAHVLEAIRRLNKKVYAVLITSDKCYENVEWKWGYRESDRVGGKDPYSASKGAAEVVIHGFCQSFFNKNGGRYAGESQICSTRAGNVIGGGDWAERRIVPDAYRAWSQNKPVVIRSPNATRPWQHVLEALSGYLCLGMQMCINPEIHCEAYNFGPNADQNKTVVELLDQLATHAEYSKQKEYVQIEQQQNFHEAGLLKLNCDKALFDLQWKPVLRFEQTAEFTASWYQKYYRSINENTKTDSQMLNFTIEQIKSYCEIASKLKLDWTQH